MIRAALPIASLCTLLAGAAPAAATELLSVSLAAAPGRVLMLRHADAPGTGDPPNFRVDDCSTQRNLDDTGRAQARALGERLRAAGLTKARVYSSQWCRCLETARLLDLGTVTPLPALNSFFGRPEDEAPRIRALRDFLADLPADGTPVVLVTHQVTIRAMTGFATPTLGGALFALNGTREPSWLGLVATR